MEPRPGSITDVPPKPNLGHGSEQRPRRMASDALGPDTLVSPGSSVSGPPSSLRKERGAIAAQVGICATSLSELLNVVATAQPSVFTGAIVFPVADFYFPELPIATNKRHMGLGWCRHATHVGQESSGAMSSGQNAEPVRGSNWTAIIGSLNPQSQ